MAAAASLPMPGGGGAAGNGRGAAGKEDGWHGHEAAAAMDWRALAGHWKVFRVRHVLITKSWLVRACTALLLWSCLFHGMSCFRDLWQPPLTSSCVDRFPRRPLRSALAAAATTPFGTSGVPWVPSTAVPPYRSNGYLIVSCNGGLNQMRAAICDMVAVTKHMNVTLVIPELDKTSFWQDPSDFGDIFDVDHFINSLRDEVRIVKELPSELAAKVKEERYFGLPPRSWSNETYYSNEILPLVQKYEVLRLNKTDARLANNGLPLAMQKLRCRVNYHSLRFTPRIEQLGQKLIRILQQRGKFLVLHLRYEMDMLAFTGCTQGCTQEEADYLTKLRYAAPWWKEKEISSDKKRQAGLCPLTPEETALVLRALGYGRDTQVYIAAGEIYGSERRMKALEKAFPNLVRKEMILSAEEMRPFFNRSSQMAALDYLVSVASDVFVPTYDGNMAKVVEGHRRYLGFQKTIRLDRRKLVELLDVYQNRTMSWDAFAQAVKGVHEGRVGSRAPRRVVPGRPKEEDYFYSNPQECVCDEKEPSSFASHSRTTTTKRS